MPTPACPVCTVENVLAHPDHWECATCGHEWPKDAAPEAARVVKDANGNVLADGDTVALIKDLKLGSSSQVLKAGTKAKGIRLQDGDHEVSWQDRGHACRPQGLLREETLRGPASGRNCPTFHALSGPGYISV